MFKRYKEIKDNRKKYRGFTLIELLAILLILFIIFTIVIYSFTDIFKSAKETISKSDKNTILSAANNYALEYRGSDGWVEEVKNDGTVNFCVSLDSLINYGYFKNDGSNFEKYKNEYVVEFQIKNGVSSYEFINIFESENCKFIDFSSTIENSHINTEIKDDKGNPIGEFNYEINRISDRKYSFDFDMSMNLINMIRDIYVTLVLDKSGSMGNVNDENSKFRKARDAAVDFSNALISSDKADAQVALIMFNEKASLARDFKHEKLVSADFGSANGQTNIGAGLDMAISLICHKGLDVDSSDSQWCTEISDVSIDNTKKKKLYTILFFDGEMNRVPLIKDDKNDLDVNKINNMTGVNRFNSLKKYYDVFLSSSQNTINTNDINRDINVVFDRYIKPSTDILKNDLDVNLFMIGYDFSTSIRNLKQSASSGDKLCAGSNYRGFCYYDADTLNINNVLNIILDNIVNDSGVSKLKFTFSSVKTDDGQDLITILNPDDSMIENNELVIEIDDLNTRTEDFENSLRGYKFILNDPVYNYCSLDEIDECDISANLFNASLDIEYVNGEKMNDNLEPPKFDLVLTDRKTIN